MKWDEQIEIPDPIPDEILPIQREDSNPILANVIAHQDAVPIKKKKKKQVVIVSNAKES